VDDILNSRAACPQAPWCVTQSVVKSNCARA